MPSSDKSTASAPDAGFDTKALRMTDPVDYMGISRLSCSKRRTRNLKIRILTSGHVRGWLLGSTSGIRTASDVYISSCIVAGRKNEAWTLEHSGFKSDEGDTIHVEKPVRCIPPHVRVM